MNPPLSAARARNTRPLALSLCVVLLIGASPSALVLHTDTPEMAGFQAQRPVWAPGAEPRLVHEMSDRDERAWLRVVPAGAQSGPSIVGVTGGSRLSAMGDTNKRADSSVAWWSPTTFFFVRAAGQRSRLHYFDGHARAVGPDDLRVIELAADGARRLLVGTIEVGDAVELVSWPGGDVSRPPVVLTRSPEEVEHSLVLDGARGLVRFVASSREASALRAVTLGGQATGTSVHGGAAGLEFVAIAALPGSDALLSYARPVGATPGSSHHLVEVRSNGSLDVLAKDVFLPPGLAPRPAVRGDGAHCYYVAHDAPRGNPVYAFDRTTRKSQVLSLGTRGHQEVAAATYAEAGGRTRTWLAIVTVGGTEAMDVRNHLYAGPLDP